MPCHVDLASEPYINSNTLITVWLSDLNSCPADVTFLRPGNSMNRSVRVPMREHVHARTHTWVCLCLLRPAPLLLSAAPGPGRALSISGWAISLGRQMMTWVIAAASFRTASFLFVPRIGWAHLISILVKYTKEPDRTSGGTSLAPGQPLHLMCCSTPLDYKSQFPQLTPELIML